MGFITDEDIMGASKSSYCCGYRALKQEATLTQLRNYCEATRRHFTPIAKSFTPEENSLWLLRHYLATKFVAAANLFAGSSEYAYRHNLLMGVPYFSYYAVLSVCRAYLMTSPLVVWNSDTTVKMTHKKILNCTADGLRALDPSRRDQWLQQMEYLRDQRELFSYKFPLSGPDFVGRNTMNPGPSTKLARLVAELAALNSECFEAVLTKHAEADMAIVDLPDHRWAQTYTLAGIPPDDAADRHRFTKLRRGWRTVLPLHLMISDGHHDDLYGSWCDPDREGASDGFDPDNYSSLILQL